MRFNVVTLFPKMIENALAEGVVGQAKNRNFELFTVNPRDHTSNRHQSVDDRPFGGGDGMVMMIEPLEQALKSLGDNAGHVVYLTPRGKLWTDAMAREWSRRRGYTVTFICGRYGGIDQRFIQHEVDEEISVGDFILSGGELACLTVIDSVARYLPGVLGNPESFARESFADGLLECPQFTRPRESGDFGVVPEILIGGDHARIARFRHSVAVVSTYLTRPDLWRKYPRPFELEGAVMDVLGLSDADLANLGIDRRILEGVGR